MELTNEEKVYIYNVFHQVTIPASQAPIVASILIKLASKNEGINNSVEGEVVGEKKAEEEKA